MSVHPFSSLGSCVSTITEDLCPLIGSHVCIHCDVNDVSLGVGAPHISHCPVSIDTGVILSVWDFRSCESTITDDS